MKPANEQEYLVGLARIVSAQVVQALRDEGLIHDDRPLLTTKDAAARLDIGERTLTEMVERGEITMLTVAKGTRKVEPGEIDRYIEQQRRLAWMAAGREDPGVTNA